MHQNVRWFVPPEHQSEVGERGLSALRSGQALEHEAWNIREKWRAMPDAGSARNRWRCPTERQGILVVARDITQSEAGRVEQGGLPFPRGEARQACAHPVEAARAIYASADQLWQWDAASLSLYSQESDVMESVLTCDVIDGERRELNSAHPAACPHPHPERGASCGKARGVNSAPARRRAGRLEFVRFGDSARLSASMMCVPMATRRAAPVGVLSIQSYTPNAYTQEDLRTLQALADYCAGALERIRNRASPSAARGAPSHM